MQELKSIQDGYRMLAIAVLDRAVADTTVDNVGEMGEFLNSREGELFLEVSFVDADLVKRCILNTKKKSKTLKKPVPKKKDPHCKPVKVIKDGQTTILPNIQQAAEFSEFSYATVRRYIKLGIKTKDGYSFKLA